MSAVRIRSSAPEIGYQMQQVLVVRTKKVEEVVKFLEQHGLTFVQEKHGDGPIHYASENGSVVFEVYPQV